MKKEMVNLMVLAGKVLTPVGKLLLKLAKTAKVMKTALIGASFVTYAFMFTWQFAAMLMVFLFVHEYGHVWAMKRVGIKTKGMYFIPFLGAAAVADGDFGSCRNEVFVALAGPVWGIGLALVAVGLWASLHVTMFAGAAIWMFLVTLFNLLPIMPLDGGRVLRCIGYSIHSWGGVGVFLAGIILMCFLAKYLSVGLILFFLVIGGLEVVSEAVGYELAKRRLKKREDAAKALGVKDYSYDAEGRLTNVEIDTDKMLEHMKDDMKGVVGASEGLVLFDPRKKEEYDGRVAHALVDVYFESLRLKRRPVLSRQGMAMAACALLAVGAFSFGAMVTMKNVPGAEMALKVLEDK